MTVASYLFWLSLGLVIYVWVGYPVLVFVLASLFARKRNCPEQASDPFVSIIVPVHNEEQKIASKLGDCLELLYPPDSLEILVASDGSTDRTEEIVRGFAARDSRIRWLQSDRRVGKSGVQKLAVPHAHGEILSFLPMPIPLFRSESCGQWLVIWPTLKWAFPRRRCFSATPKTRWRRDKDFTGVMNFFYAPLSPISASWPPEADRRCSCGGNSFCRCPLATAMTASCLSMSAHKGMKSFRNARPRYSTPCPTALRANSARGSA